jgi:hypothetical protein
MSHDTDKTCGECGLDRAIPRERMLERAVVVVENEAERLRYRVTELEAVIRAFVKGSASVNTLRSVAESPA